MALSPSTAWVEAVTREGARIRYWAEIYYDVSNSWVCTSGSMDSSSDLYGTDVGLQKVAPLAPEVDPFTREVSIGEVFGDFDDPWLRPKIVNYRLEGKRIHIKWGAAELNAADFVDLFKGQISEIIPVDHHTVTISFLNQMEILERNLIVGYWINKHPAEVLYDGSDGILDKGGAVSVTASDFDPSTGQYSGKSHIIISRMDSLATGYEAAVSSPDARARDYGGLNEGTSALICAQQVASLLNAHLTVDEAGDFGFKIFDATASSLATWTDDDFLGPVKQEPLGANIVNRIMFDFKAGPDGNWRQSFQMNETASQSAYAYPGESERIFSRKITNDWVGTNFWLESDIASGSTSSFVLYKSTTHALSGNRADAWAAISGTQPLYLMLDSTFIPDIKNCEIIKATGLTRGTTSPAVFSVWDPETQAYVTESGWDGKVTISSITRNEMGTSTSDHKGTLTQVYDITPLVLLGEDLLKRFAFDCPIIEFETYCDKYKFQLGDFIVPQTNSFAGYNRDGLSSDKFELISKEVDLSADPPRIKWKAAATGVVSITRTGRGGFFRGHDPGADHLALNTVTEGIVDAGQTVSAAGGLNVSVGYGTATDGNKRSYSDTIAQTLVASKDTYIKRDVTTGGLIFDAVNNGAATPFQHKSEVLLAKVVTDGAGVTDVFSGKTLHPLMGSSLDGDARNQHGVWADHYDNYKSEQWQVLDAATSLTIDDTGVAGGKAWIHEGHSWYINYARIQFDPSKLYRLRVRCRMTQRDSGPTPADETIVLGMSGYASDALTPVGIDGTTVATGLHGFAAYGDSPFADFGLNTWGTYTGWFQGIAATGTHKSPDPTSPGKFHTNVRYMSIVVSCNRAAGDGIQAIDYVALDVFDEESESRTYNAIESSTAVTPFIIQDSLVFSNSQQMEQELNVSLNPNATFVHRSKG